MLRKSKLAGSPFAWAKKLFASSLLAGAALSLLPSAASAAIVYWDMNGATPGSGVTTSPSTFGVWGTGSTNQYWSTDSTGSLATAAWVAGNTAVFSAGSDANVAFNVTNSLAAVNVGGITVEE